jgi:hypothetical protein
MSPPPNHNGNASTVPPVGDPGPAIGGIVSATTARTGSGCIVAGAVALGGLCGVLIGFLAAFVAPIVLDLPGSERAIAAMVGAVFPLLGVAVGAIAASSRRRLETTFVGTDGIARAARRGGRVEWQVLRFETVVDARTWLARSPARTVRAGHTTLSSGPLVQFRCTFLGPNGITLYNIEGAYSGTDERFAEAGHAVHFALAAARAYEAYRRGRH